MAGPRGLKAKAEDAWEALEALPRASCQGLKRQLALDPRTCGAHAGESYCTLQLCHRHVDRLTWRSLPWARCLVGLRVVDAALLAARGKERVAAERSLIARSPADDVIFAAVFSNERAHARDAYLIGTRTNASAARDAKPLRKSQLVWVDVFVMIDDQELGPRTAGTRTHGIWNNLFLESVPDIASTHGLRVIAGRTQAFVTYGDRWLADAARPPVFKPQVQLRFSDGTVPVVEREEGKLHIVGHKGRLACARKPKPDPVTIAVVDLASFQSAANACKRCLQKLRKDTGELFPYKPRVHRPDDPLEPGAFLPGEEEDWQRHLDRSARAKAERDTSRAPTRPTPAWIVR
jgi:hypothetical protein